MISTWILWWKPSKYLTRSSIRPSLISPYTSSSTWSSQAGWRWLPDSGGVEEDHDTAGGEDAYKVRPYPPPDGRNCKSFMFPAKKFPPFFCNFSHEAKSRNQCWMQKLYFRIIGVTWTGYENVFLHIWFKKNLTSHSLVLVSMYISGHGYCNCECRKSCQLKFTPKFFNNLLPQCTVQSEASKEAK